MSKDEEKNIAINDGTSDENSGSGQDGATEIQPGEFTDNADGLQRRLGNRQIQLIAIGGSIGTALFVR
jgi:amino acid transporter